MKSATDRKKIDLPFSIICRKALCLIEPSIFSSESFATNAAENQETAQNNIIYV